MSMNVEDIRELAVFELMPSNYYSDRAKYNVVICGVLD